MSVVHMILLIDPQRQVGRMMFFCNYIINAFNFDGEASFFALQLFFFFLNLLLFYKDSQLCLLTICCIK